MPTRRMMVFIDGENLTMRYQDMLLKGSKPAPDTVHVPDVFVWNPKTLNATSLFNIIRVNYYTYAVGDDVQLEEWSNQIKQFPYTYRESRSDFSDSGFLYPQIFKKYKKSAKRKGVDISITVESLVHTFRNSIDIVYLMTGDGDYMPLIKEIIRNGKQVYLGSLSEGLNPILPKSVDRFINLDKYFFM